MKARFTPTARDQFLAALAYIPRDDPATAARYRRRVEAGLRRLEQFPEAGRVLPEFPDLPYREVIIPPHRFFYRVRERTIWVVAVWHGAQLAAEPEAEKT